MSKLSRKPRFGQIPMYAAAGALVACSAYFNSQFGASLGQTDNARLAWQAASVGSDVLKAGLPVVLVTAIINRDLLRSLASILLIAVTATYSVAAAVGFAATSRADMSSGNSDQMQAYDRSVTASKRLSGEISRIEESKRWTSTDACSNATVRLSKKFCKTNKPLHTMAIADLETVRSILSKGRPAQADPQAVAIAAALGLTVLQVQTGLSWLAASLVELGSLFGFLIASGRRSGARPVAKPARTANHAPVASLPAPGAQFGQEQAYNWLQSRQDLEASNRQLAGVWNVSHSTAGRWVKALENEGRLLIEQVGKTRRIMVAA